MVRSGPLGAVQEFSVSQMVPTSGRLLKGNVVRMTLGEGPWL